MTEQPEVVPNIGPDAVSGFGEPLPGMWDDTEPLQGETGPPEEDE